MSESKAPSPSKANQEKVSEEKKDEQPKKARFQFSIKKWSGLKRTLSPIEKIFVGIVLVSAPLGTTLTFYGLSLYRNLGRASLALHEAEPGAHGSEAAHGDAGAHGEGEKGDSHQEDLLFGQNAIPESILERQDGQREASQDLVEPEIEQNRSLSSIFKEDVKVVGLPKYVDLTEIIAGTRGSSEADAVMIGDVVLLVDTYDVQQEALRKALELKSIVSSIVADLTKDELRSFEGKVKFKTLVQREMNHLLKSGQVKDVLLSKFLIR